MFSHLLTKKIAGPTGLIYIDTSDDGDDYNSVFAEPELTGILNYIDTDDQGDSYRCVWGDGNFIYVACGDDGLRSYSVDGEGNVTNIDTE